MSKRSVAPEAFDDEDEEGGVELGVVTGALLARKGFIAALTLAGGVAGLGVGFLIPPTFTARTLILPPQQSQTSAASALGSLGPLAGLAGGLTGMRSPAEQYISLMGSATITDKMVDRFKLMEVYDKEYRSDTRKKLASAVLFTTGKKDSLITIEVEDKDPKRAADMANAYVEYLRWMTNNLAVTEAQQRRVFFEQKLGEAKANLTKAQIDLQSSGFNGAALKAEPRAAAEGYARLKAEITAAEVKYQAMRRILADTAPELGQQQAILSTLRAELSKLEARQEQPAQDADYIARYREYKYQETLFELYARQFELARADESREGGLIQVVDVATPPDKKSKPKRAYFAVGGAVAALVLACLHVVMRRRPDTGQGAHAASA